MVLPPRAASQASRRVEWVDQLPPAASRDSGLVEEDATVGASRALWRSCTSVAVVPRRVSRDPEARRASVAMLARCTDGSRGSMSSGLARKADWDKAWVDAAGPSDDVLVMTRINCSRCRRRSGQGGAALTVPATT